MPRKSTNPNKSQYQICREECGLSREAASEQLNMSDSRLEKLENGQTRITPQDVVDMAKAYKQPKLCNYYCANDCEIGQKSVPELKAKGLTEIVLSMLNSLNQLNQEKDRLIQIAADNEITSDELPDFVTIKKHLAEISITADTLQLWIDDRIADGSIKKEDYDSLNA